jgi:hypothetical protein
MKAACEPTALEDRVGHWEMLDQGGLIGVDAMSLDCFLARVFFSRPASLC